MIENVNVLWDVCQQMTDNLKANATKLGDISEAKLNAIAGEPGIYAAFYNGRQLGLGLGKTDGLEIVFMGENSRFTRDMVEDNTANSGIRRSLAAMLSMLLELKAKPGNDNANDLDRFDNYALIKVSEEKLSVWMKENLYIGHISVPEEDVEKYIQAMVDCNAPVFNLRNNKGSQFGSEVKHYRKIMTEQARLFEAENA
jgi:hypothetical protein